MSEPMMAAGRQFRIVVAGAGSIGCYVGGCLALAGRQVTLLARPALVEAIASSGLRISDLEGADRTLAPGAVRCTADPASALAGADLVLLTVKSGATREMGGLIARHAPADAIVVSLQNGVGNIDVLREVLQDSHPLIAGMVPFNVVQTRREGQAPRFHRATSGTLLIAPGQEGLRACLDVPGLAVAERDDMPAVLWGKLLLNLNNALNALSGLPLATQVADRRWRLLLAAQMEEALAVLKAARIKPARIEGVPPRAIPLILCLPDLLFRLIARRVLTIDPEARSSMWEDLQQRRPTEIAYLQGAILTLAERHGVPVPMTRRVIGLIAAAERAGAGPPGLQPDDISSRPA
jgi:2-dehydropantoate 2-reductase